MQLPTVDYQPLRPTKSVPVGVIAVVAILTVLIVPALTIRFAFEQSTLALILSAAAAILFIVIASQYNNRYKNKALLAFARKNNLSYRQNTPPPAYGGLIFNDGHSRKLSQWFEVPTDAGTIELGNFEYTTGSGKSSQKHDYGFVRLKLPRKLPHMVLDANDNNFFMFSNLPKLFDKDQRLQLEGDFNKHFTLYAPGRYERDALYVFTPDVMAALVDHALGYDIEIIDDDLFIYSSQPFKFNDERIWKKLLFMASELNPEFEAQTDYYADDRVGNRLANVVSDDGRRLKPGFSWLTIFIVSFIVGNQIIGMFGRSLIEDWHISLVIFGLLVVAMRFIEKRTISKNYYRRS